MPAQPGYLMSAERHNGTAWVDLVDIKASSLSLDPGMIDVTTHRHIDANDALHAVFIPGKRTVEISGTFIAHANSLGWMFQSFMGTGTVDARLRFTMPNLGTLEGYFLLTLTIDGSEDGAIQGSFTARPSVQTVVGTTPVFTPET